MSAACASSGEAVKITGRFDEAFFADWVHPDCHAAGQAYWEAFVADIQEAWCGLTELLAYDATESVEFQEALQWLRDRGWQAVADRLMKAGR